MSRLNFGIAFMNGKKKIDLTWHFSRCFKVDLSTEVVHNTFAILQIFSRGWLTALEAG